MFDNVYASAIRLEVPNLKLLGLIYDRTTAFETHIDQLCKKLSKRLGFLKHISPYLKKQQREMYYNGIIKPTLCIGVWYGTIVPEIVSKEF